MMLSSRYYCCGPADQHLLRSPALLTSARASYACSSGSQLQLLLLPAADAPSAAAAVVVFSAMQCGTTLGVSSQPKPRYSRCSVGYNTTNDWPCCRRYSCADTTCWSMMCRCYHCCCCCYCRHSKEVKDLFLRSQLLRNIITIGHCASNSSF